MGEKERCGYVAIVGRPNVGKSTLLNYLLGQKISITSRKPQTTRYQILGIKTVEAEAAQIIFVDTPGLHRHHKGTMNRYMNRAAIAALSEVDVIIFMVDGLRWTEDDDWIMEKLKGVDTPVILAVNKIDKLPDKDTLLPYVQTLAQKMAFVDIVPLSAKSGKNVEVIQRLVAERLPARDYLFPEDQITDRSERFLAGEIIREKIMRTTGEELPYSVAVAIEEFKLKNNILHINAIIWVEKDGQKAIIIGKEGQQLKDIGKQARLDMEKLFDRKVFLRLWVKVKKGWSEDENALHTLGLG